MRTGFSGYCCAGTEAAQKTPKIKTRSSRHQHFLCIIYTASNDQKTDLNGFDRSHAGDRVNQQSLR
jgi:hypothetical protein